MAEMIDAREANRRIAYLTRFEQVVTSLALTLSATSLETMDTQLVQVLQQIAEFEQATSARIFLLDTVAGKIQRVYRWTELPAGDERFEYEHIAGLLPWLQSGQPVILPAHYLSQAARDGLALESEHTVIAAPLVTEHITGFMYLDCPQYQSPGDVDARLPDRAATLLATNLERLFKRRQIIERFQQTQDLLRIVVDHIPGLIYVKDTESRFLLGNAAIVKHLNVASESELLGRTDVEFHPADMAAKYRTDELNLLQSGVPMLHQEEQVVHRDTGETHWYSTSKIPLKAADGTILGLVGINTDVTERKMADIQLQAKKDELEAGYIERSVELRRTHEQLQHEMAERRQQEAEVLALQQQVIDAQRQAILELSTPVIPILEQVLVMPLVGSIDTARASSITRALLSGITQHRAKVVIVDITGVSIVDSGVAGHLNRTMLAARLKGVRTIVTGISDAVAETMVDLGIDWSTVDTLPDLQSGLRMALGYLGYKVSRAAAK